MGLQEYQRKRDFSATPEPADGGRSRTQPIFVVQLHHASHRHYDFRLELDGVLKSWAVPKGPSFDPDVKRLAMEVEDHPLSYADFAGDIPTGHYGAGHVDVFDSGTWQAQGSARSGLRDGELKFVLHGDILKGSWVLVRTRKQGSKQQWLLIKHRDEFAHAGEADDFVDKGSDRPLSVVARSKPKASKAAAGDSSAGAAKRPDRTSVKSLATADLGIAETLLNDAFAPQLCTAQAQAPDGDDWLHEAKWDGFRLLATVVRRRVRLWSRNGIEWTRKLPELVDAIAGLGLRSAQLDGELVALSDDRDDFNTLQARLAGENEAELSYRVFDLLHVDGRSLRGLRLLERKTRLQALLDAAPASLLRYSAHQRGHGPTVFAQAVAGGLEGIVSKRVDGGYRGGRSKEWVKVKARLSDEFVVVGYTEPKGARQGIGALLLAKPDGKGLRYVGRVGTGFDDAGLRDLRRQLEPTTVVTTDVDPAAMAAADRRLARWVKPGFVVEVFHQGHGGNGLLRQASFKVLRTDKSIKDLSSIAGSTTGKQRKKAATIDSPPTKLSHPERIVFPALGLSKADVAAYYASMQGWLLPEVVGRPLSVLRCPDGVGKTCFFQKHAGKGWGEHIHALAIPESSGRIDHLQIDDGAGLAELIQMNVLELHPWGSRSDDVEQADRIVFDLDPHASVDFKAVIAAAREVRARLQSVGLESFVRTSGGKGVHVVVPLSPPEPWKAAKAFAEAVAKTLAQQHPDRYVAIAGESKRKGRIFIDWLRNGRGATSVASYSLRARDSAGVAMPLAWSALGRVRRGDAYTIGNALRHVSQRSSDPWAQIGSIRQALPRGKAALKPPEPQPGRPAARKSAAAPRGRGSAR